MKKIHHMHTKGFTLIEVLVVIGIIAVLAAIVLVAVNPTRQFKLARDSQRTSNVTTLLNAIGQNVSENGGLFKCSGVATSFPASSTLMKTGGFDVAPCLIPNYISAIPFDPSKSGAHYSSPTDYDSEYSIFQDTSGRLTISALSEISASTISVTR